MISRSGPPKFDPKDWSKFDFSRWHLDGAPLDATAAAIADLAQRLFSSPEWRQQFQTSVPALQKQVLELYKGENQQLQAQVESIKKDFAARTETNQARTAAVRQSIERAAAPPSVKPDPNSYQLAVKVVSEKAKLGLAGLLVRIRDPRNPEQALAQAATDSDGNAVLSVPKEVADKLEKTEPSLDVLGPQGKPLLQIDRAICPRANQTETKVLQLPDSPDLEPLKGTAAQLKAQRESRARNLESSVGRLKADQDSMVENINARIQDNQQIIDQLEKDLPGARSS